MKQFKGIHLFLTILVLSIVLSGCSKDSLMPKACITTDKTTAAVGEPILFQDCSEDAFSIEIDFGDGNFSRDHKVWHAYLKEGEYTVTLSAWSKNGRKKSQSRLLITIKGEWKDSIPDTTHNTNELKPTACFQISSDTVETGETVQFTNCSVNAQSYNWDFGDGTTSTASNPTHTYTSAGTYQVRLTVTNVTLSDDTVLTVFVGDRYLNTIIVHSFSPTTPNGDDWDPPVFPIPGIPVEPDIRIKLESASGATLTTPTDQNTTLNELPLVWNVSGENLKLTNENWTVTMEDDDTFQGGSAETMAQWQNVNLGTMGSNGSVLLTSGSYSVELLFKVR